MAQGLIAAALGGFGKGLATFGEMESKRQNEAKLRKELMAAESEERLRIDEITRKRDIEGIGLKTQATAKANLEAAPLVGQAEVASEAAKLDAAKTGKLYEKRGEAKVTSEAAELDAAKTGKLYEKRAEAEVGGQMAKLDVRTKLEADKKEAEAAANKRLEELRAEKDKGVTKLEAEKNARAEKEKYDAMISNGVPEAKAKALMADWNAGKAQRDAAAVETVENAIKAEIEKVKKLSTDKGYVAGKRTLSIADSAGNIAEINAREAARDKKEKTEKARNTADMQRQITATERQIADALGVEPKKANDEKQYLEDRAATGKATPAEKAKLAKIKPLSDELNDLRRELRSFKRSDSSSPSEKTSYDYVPGKGLVETKK